MASLSDLTYFANRSQGGIGAEEVNSDRGRNALAAARKYDPGASWRQVYGSDGQSLGYTLDFDASKLPGASGQGSLGGTSGHGSGADYQIPFSTVQPGMLLDDPSKVTNSPVYGQITDNTNINPRSPLSDSLLGLGAVTGFAFGIPYLASAMSNGAIGAGATAGSAGAASGSMSINPDTLATASMTGNSGFSGALGAGGAAAPIVDLGTPARVGDVIRNGGIPGISNIGQSVSELGTGLLSKIPGLAKIPGLLGGGNVPVGALGGGGGGLLGLGGGGSAQDAAAILRAFYAPRHNILNDPRVR